MAKKLTQHQKMLKTKEKTYKIIFKLTKTLVKKYGLDNVRYSFNHWLIQERERRRWLNKKKAAEQELREIEKKIRSRQ